MWETWVQSLGWEDPLEEGMATQSSILAGRSPMDRGAWWATYLGSQRVEHDWEIKPTHTTGLLVSYWVHFSFPSCLHLSFLSFLISMFFTPCAFSKINLFIFILFIFGCARSSLLGVGFSLPAVSRGYSSLRSSGYQSTGISKLWLIGSRVHHPIRLTSQSFLGEAACQWLMSLSGEEWGLSSLLGKGHV